MLLCHALDIILEGLAAETIAQKRNVQMTELLEVLQTFLILLPHVSSSLAERQGLF